MQAENQKKGTRRTRGRKESMHSQSRAFENWVEMRYVKDMYIHRMQSHSQTCMTNREDSILGGGGEVGGAQFQGMVNLCMLLYLLCTYSNVFECVQIWMAVF